MQLDIKIQELGDPPLHPELEHTPFTEIELKEIVVLQGGMQSGKTSISFFAKDAQGRDYFMQTSGAMFEAAAAALKGAEERWKEKGN